MDKKKWLSYQSVTIMVIVLMILFYMTIDLTIITPDINKKIQDISIEYNELTLFLDKKIPEIDSTFKIHSEKIEGQKIQIDQLTDTFTELNNKE